jgi:hypothetical protein
MAQGGSPQAVPPAVFGSDTFTGTIGTALESHTPDRGGSWVANSTNGGSQAVLDSANRARNRSTSLVAYTIAAIPPSADQAVQADVIFLSRNLQAYDADVTARFSTTSVTGYSAGYNSHSQLWHISQWNGGTQTPLQTVSAALVSGNSYTAKLLVQGSTLQLYINGTLTIGPYADTNPITTTGNAGILLRVPGTTADSDSTGAHLDNFIAQSANASADVLVNYEPTASGGLALNGSAGQTALHSLIATGGTPFSGARVFVMDTAVAASGGIAPGGCSLGTQSWLITPSGGLRQGSCCRLQAGSLYMPTGGSSQGGHVSSSQAIALVASVHMAAGGAACAYTGSIDGGPITQGLATRWTILQGYQGTIRFASGGLGQGGRADFGNGQHCAPPAGGGMASGGSASSLQQSELTSVGLITQGLGTGQGLTQGYSIWCPHAYQGGTSGGVRLGGSAAVSVNNQLSASVGTSLGGSNFGVPIIYHVYMNSGHADPINYATSIAKVTGLSWTSGLLPAPGDYKLGVRAYDSRSSLEEQNVDAVVEVVLDAGGKDITHVPPPPLGLRALPLAGRRIRVEWASCCSDRSRVPLGFHIYLGTGITPDYSKPVATVAMSDQRQGRFAADLGNMTDAITYLIGIRAFNAVGEETNTIVLFAKADGDPPSVVDSLQAVATDQDA